MTTAVKIPAPAMARIVIIACHLTTKFLTAVDCCNSGRHFVTNYWWFWLPVVPVIIRAQRVAGRTTGPGTDERESTSVVATRLERLDSIRLHLTDTQASEESHEPAYRLHQLLRVDDVLASTWRGYGHPGHKATGRVCAQLADDRKLALIELPISTCHWAELGSNRVP